VNETLCASGIIYSAGWGRRPEVSPSGMFNKTWRAITRGCYSISLLSLRDRDIARENKAFMGCPLERLTLLVLLREQMLLLDNNPEITINTNILL